MELNDFGYLDAVVGNLEQVRTEQAENIAAGMAAADPAHAGQYAANCAAYTEKLRALKEETAAALAPFAQPVSVEVYPAGYTLPADAPYMDLAAFINAPPGWEYVPAGAEAAAETARGDVRGLHITGTDGELWIYDDTDWIRIRSAAGDICVSCGHSGTEMLDWLWRWALETAAQPEG